MEDTIKTMNVCGKEVYYKIDELTKELLLRCGYSQNDIDDMWFDILITFEDIKEGFCFCVDLNWKAGVAILHDEYRPRVSTVINDKRMNIFSLDIYAEDMTNPELFYKNYREVI